ERRGEVRGSRGLTDAALLVGDGENSSLVGKREGLGRKSEASTGDVGDLTRERSRRIEGAGGGHESLSVFHVKHRGRRTATLHCNPAPLRSRLSSGATARGPTPWPRSSSAAPAVRPLTRPLRGLSSGAAAYRNPQSPRARVPVHRPAAGRAAAHAPTPRDEQ